MGSIYKRKNKLWLRFKGPDGAWTQSKTPFTPEQRVEARKLLLAVEAKIAAGAAVAEDTTGPVTVSSWATRWLKDRAALKLSDTKNDRARLNRYILRVLGSMAIDEVRPKHVNDLVSRLRTRGKLAPKTIRNIYGTMKALFRDAVIADLLDRSPCILTKYQLGENGDADPEWREGAIYSRDELETMISDPLVPWDRRVMYALQGIGGMRHGEAAGLRWRHWNPDVEPLGRLTVAHSYSKQTKTGRTRWTPVHPTLNAILAEWKLSGWPQMMGRIPDPDDLIVPTPQCARIPLGRMRDKNNSWKWLSDDLAALGLRHRRGHDLRRTMISLAVGDGARKDLLELCTHTPGRRAAIDLYLNMPWEACCTEVAKLKVRRREPAEVVVLAQAVGAEHDAVGGDASDDDGDGGAEEGSQAVLATPLATPGGNEMRIQEVEGWRRRESNGNVGQSEYQCGARTWPSCPTKQAQLDSRRVPPRSALCRSWMQGRGNLTATRAPQKKERRRLAVFLDNQGLSSLRSCLGGRYAFRFQGRCGGLSIALKWSERKLSVSTTVFDTSETALVSVEKRT